MVVWHCCFSLCLFPSHLLAQQLNNNGIVLNGKSYYINGVNLPWHNFGWDFGEHEYWGSGFDATWFEQSFAELAISGVNCVRLWVHCDGRANPEFDQHGYVTGLDANFLTELAALVSLAEEYNLLVILNLWSHDMLEDRRDVAGPTAGMHRSLITNIAKTNSYINNALIPMVQHLNQFCNILAWEVINEPEWGMDIAGGGTTKQVVSKQEMQLFVGRCIKAIKQHSEQMVTVGAYQPFYNQYEDSYHIWHESEFEALGFNCQEVYLDFYSIHYYNWMKNKLSPFKKEAVEWQLGRPVLLAEIASAASENSDGLLPMEQLQSCIDNGYAGVLFWSYQAEDSFSDWSNCAEAVQEFSEQQRAVTYYNNNEDCINGNSVVAPLLVCNVYPKPAQDVLFIKTHLPENDYNYTLQITLMDTQGQRVFTEDMPANQNNQLTEIDISQLLKGYYFLQIDFIYAQTINTQHILERVLIL